MCTSEENIKEQCFKRFASEPNGKNAAELVFMCRKEAMYAAGRWHDPCLTFSEKVKEIISEMFLILLEEFDPSGANYYSVISFMRRRLLRITVPRGKSFLDVDDIDETHLEGCGGRDNFDAEKIEIASEMVSRVREALFMEPSSEGSLLCFLFIHVYPEAVWAGRMMADFYGAENTSARVAADRKRLYRFNARLRDKLMEIPDFNIKEIADWSRGERSHLAWRIIDIGPSEIEKNAEESLNIVEKWRDDFHKNDACSSLRMNAAINVLNSMKRLYGLGECNSFEEEGIIYGSVPPLIETLLGLPTAAVSENDSDFDSYSANSFSDKEFAELAQSCASWFDKLMAAKLQNNSKHR